ncbi:unnamed protein product, partial [Urochloa humidicola]
HLHGLCTVAAGINAQRCPHGRGRSSKSPQLQPNVQQRAQQQAEVKQRCRHACGRCNNGKTRKLNSVGSDPVWGASI